MSVNPTPSGAPVTDKVSDDIANMPTGTGGTTGGSRRVYDPYSYVPNFVPRRVSTDAGQRTVSPGDEPVSADAAMLLWEQLKDQPGAIDAFKRSLYYAGAYGNKAPVIGSDQLSRADIEAAYLAVDAANLNGAGGEVRKYVEQLAIKGRELGVPVGQEVDPAETPGARLRDYLTKNGLDMGEEFVAENVKRISTGDISTEDVIGHIRDRYLVNAYPAWADQLKAGANLSDLAAPYQKSMAEVLELPADAIGLDDPMLKKAMAAVTTDGKPTYKPLWQFEQDLRQDPRWLQTNRAQDEIANTATDVLKTFGFMG